MLRVKRVRGYEDILKESKVTNLRNILEVRRKYCYKDYFGGSGQIFVNFVIWGYLPQFRRKHNIEEEKTKYTASTMCVLKVLTLILNKENFNYLL